MLEFRWEVGMGMRDESGRLKFPGFTSWRSRNTKRERLCGGKASQDVRRGTWDVGRGMWDVGCGTWDVGCGMWREGTVKGDWDL